MFASNLLHHRDRLLIDQQLQNLKGNPFDHGYSFQTIQNLQELDHWGKIEASIDQTRLYLSQMPKHPVVLFDWSSETGKDKEEIDKIEQADDEKVERQSTPEEQEFAGRLNNDLTNRLFTSFLNKTEADQYLMNQVHIWKKAARQLTDNHNYLYSCESNPIELPNEGVHARTLRNLFVVIGAAFAGISMFLSLLVSLTIYFNKELRDTHPSKLILMMSLSEFITCYNAFVYECNTVKFVCYWGLQNMYYDTMKIWWKEITKELAIQHLVISNIYIFYWFQQIQLCFNACLCIDLYLTFRNPFYPSGRRMKAYYIGTALVMILIQPVTQSLLYSNYDWFDHFIEPIMDTKEIYGKIHDRTLLKELKMQHEVRMFNIQLCNVIFILLYMILTAASIGFADKQKAVSSRSMGTQMTYKYMNRHKQFIRFLQIIWCVQLGQGYFHLQYHMDKINIAAADEDQALALGHRSFLISVQVLEITILIQIIQGIVLGIVRQSEPLYKFLLLREFLSWFGKLHYKDEANALASTSIYVLMNQQLSTDLVYAILKTITERTDGEVKKKYKPYDFSNQNRFLIESMVVRDPEVFQVAKIEEEKTMHQEVMEQVNFVKELHSHLEERHGIRCPNICCFGWFRSNRESTDDYERDRTSQPQNRQAAAPGNYLESFIKIKDGLQREGLEHDMFKNFQSSIFEAMKTSQSKLNVGDKAYQIIDREIKVVEYAPDVFAHLRALDGFNNFSLSESLDPMIEANVHKIFKAGEGMGKSGSFFFFSHDDRFLIKSMTLSDFNAFMKLFPYFFEHITQFQDSILARIYGIYRVDMEGMVPVYLLLMGNTKKIDNMYVKKIYDLKGSLAHRLVDGKESDFKNTECLKDLNLLNIINDEVLMKFSASDAKIIMRKIAQDVGLLSQFNLMDYSLLFCISFNPRYVDKYPDQFVKHETGELVKPYRLVNPQWMHKSYKNDKIKKKVANEFLDIMKIEEIISKDNNKLSVQYNFFGQDSVDQDLGQIKFQSANSILNMKKRSSLIDRDDDLHDWLLGDQKSRHTYMSEDGMYLYHVAIIDYLQEFNFIKKIENAYKSRVEDGNLISAVPPKQYGDRFFSFMQKNVITNQTRSDLEQVSMNKEQRRMTKIMYQRKKTAEKNKNIAQKEKLCLMPDLAKGKSVMSPITEK